MRAAEQRKVRAYGQSAQLCVEENTTRAGEPTVAFELGDRAWHKKISLQLTTAELPVMTAAVLGLRHHCHLQRADKQIWVQRQGEALYVKAQSRDAGTLALPVTPGHNCHLAALLLDRLSQVTQTSAESLLASLRLTCADAAPPPQTARRQSVSP